MTAAGEGQSFANLAEFLVTTLSFLHCNGATSCFPGKKSRKKKGELSRKKRKKAKNEDEEVAGSPFFVPVSFLSAVALWVAAEGCSKRSRNPGTAGPGEWIPAFAGMTGRTARGVFLRVASCPSWFHEWDKLRRPSENGGQTSRTPFGVPPSGG